MEYGWFVAAASSSFLFPPPSFRLFFTEDYLLISTLMYIHTENNLLWDPFQRFHIRLHHRLLVVLISGPN